MPCTNLLLTCSTRDKLTTVAPTSDPDEPAAVLPGSAGTDAIIELLFSVYLRSIAVDVLLVCASAGVSVQYSSHIA